MDEPLSNTELTPLESDLLRYLSKRREHLVPRDELQSAVWGYAESVTTRAVDACVSRLRTKLADSGSDTRILTVHGDGYLLTRRPARAPFVAAPSTLYGRESELLAVTTWAHASGGGWLSIAGPCGAGKSALLATVAAEQTKHPNTQRFPGGLARVEGVDQLRSWLSKPPTQPTLLVADLQDECLGEEAGAIYAAVQLAPVRVICATRRVLGLRGEAAVQLAPIPHEAAQQWMRDAGTCTEAVAESGHPVLLALAAGTTPLPRHASLLACATSTLGSLTDEALSALRSEELADSAELEGLLAAGLVEFTAEGPTPSAWTARMVEAYDVR